jgi:hypothetical protein
MAKEDFAVRYRLKAAMEELVHSLIPSGQRKQINFSASYQQSLKTIFADAPR